MENVKAMAYLLLGVWLFVTLGPLWFFCVAISFVARFQKWQF